MVMISLISCLFFPMTMTMTTLKQRNEYQHIEHEHEFHRQNNEQGRDENEMNGRQHKMQHCWKRNKLVVIWYDNDNDNEKKKKK